MRARGIGLAGPAGLAALTTMAAMTMAAVWLSDVRVVAQAPATADKPYSGPRTADGKPNLNGIWQALSTAHWNLEPHSPEEGVPAASGVVEGGTIPYKPEALAKRKENEAKADAPIRLTVLTSRACRASRTCRFPSRSSRRRNTSSSTTSIAHGAESSTPTAVRTSPRYDFWMGDSRGTMGEGHARGGYATLQRPDVVRQGRELPQRRSARGRTLHAARTRPHPLRGHDRGPQGLHAAVEDELVALPPRREDIQLLDYDCVDFFWPDEIEPLTREPADT